MGEITIRMPWDAVPAVRTVEDDVQSLKGDLAYIITHTSVLVHSKHTALQMLFNTARGQIIPRGECKLSDGSVVEFYDTGMPRPNAPALPVKDIIFKVLEIVQTLGLEVMP